LKAKRSRKRRRQFASQHVVLLFSGALVTTAGVVGLSGCSEQEDPPPPLPGAQAKILTQDQLAQDLKDDKEEDNNSYVPGLGYYHAVHRSWYPYPFDYYYSGFGYYRGGYWNDFPSNGVIPTRSKPDWKSVTDIPPGSAGHGYFYGGQIGAESGSSGVSRGIFTAPHFSGGGHSFGGGHGGG